MSKITTATAAELLDLAIDRAPKLRAAGILSASVAGLAITLTPADPPDVDLEDEDEEPELGVLDDPATFGRTRSVPGRRREKE